MKRPEKASKTIIVALLTLLMVLAAISLVVPMASAAGSITLTPTTQAPSGSVTVAGTGFAGSTAVGIVLGTEITVTNETITTFSGTGNGPYTATLAHYPIKPGSFSMHWDTSGTGSDWTDNGDGTLASSSSYSAGGTVNYVTGVFGRTSTLDLSSYALTATCSYTYYQYKVTPAAGVATTASGAFTTNITVPTVAAGNYVITAIDASGARATNTLIVSTQPIPEGLSIGAIVLLSVAVVVGSRYSR